MGERKKYTDIDAQSRREVLKRDGKRCVYCGRIDKPIELAHFIGRAQGGMGIPTNLLCLCVDCHKEYDGAGRNEMKDFLEGYLQSNYDDWDEREQFFRKW